MRFACDTSLCVEGKQTLILCKSKTLPKYRHSKRGSEIQITAAVKCLLHGISVLVLLMVAGNWIKSVNIERLTATCRSYQVSHK